MARRPSGDLAASLGTTPTRLRAVIRRALEHVPHERYYVFRVTGGGTGAATPGKAPRTIAAFPSPDDALAFAQRNGFGSRAQLRAVFAADLLLRMLDDDAIGAIFFARGHAEDAARGFGPGLKLTRDALLAELGGGAPAAPEQDSAPEAAEIAAVAPTELTAAHYDALQFGVNFERRARFRVALAEAVEAVVASYAPPPGAVDSGPRSIFATAAVESWLKQHGFPHAFQRRWIDVADDPRFGGAVELCEIDAGTINRLLVQLVIHQDDAGRQYIKWVNVTA